MDSISNSTVNLEKLSIPAFPNEVTAGSTILIAGTTDPSEYALGLTALCQYGQHDDSGLVVTTVDSAERTLEHYNTVCSATDRPEIGLVDTISEQQYLSAIYSDPPTVFTPSANDLERIVVALSELLDCSIFTRGSRHLIVRSLTPLLTRAPLARVCQVLQRISGLQTENGIGVYGLEYTKHDEETITELTKYVDGILWVTERSDQTLEFDFESTRRQVTPRKIEE
ncbi:DUF7504 family protein [Halomontanus rarus]|uniref:DUF7504 family protein n=1 Tax=Halomontanus rarus TaxID=3034020 RepID=UPI00293BA97A|nr:hypothetical protein [Halovivax sp. KZCA124]